MIRVAIIGCGNIGRELACYMKKDGRFIITDLVDSDPINLQILAKKMDLQPKTTLIDEAIRNADLIIESASHQAVKEILQSKELDHKGKELLLMSTGGLTRNFRLFKKVKHCRIRIPCGALAGLDAIRAVAENIDSLTITTTKPANSLLQAPYVTKNKIDLGTFKGRKKIFEGNLPGAVKGFPQNINVAAGLFLASRFDNIKVSIIADSLTRCNTHEVICKGPFGEIKTVTRNFPSQNPKTSQLAILSAISTLKDR